MYRPIFKSNPSITASVKVFLGFDKAVSLLRFKPRPRHRARSALPDPIQFIKPAGPWHWLWTIQITNRPNKPDYLCKKRRPFDGKPFKIIYQIERGRKKGEGGERGCYFTPSFSTLHSCCIPKHTRWTQLTAMACIQIGHAYLHSTLNPIHLVRETALEQEQLWFSISAEIPTFVRV